MTFETATLFLTPIDQQEARQRHRAGKLMAHAATDAQRARVFTWWCQRYGRLTAQQYLTLWRHGQL